MVYPHYSNHKMVKILIALLLLSLVISISGTDKSPEAVKNWFSKVSHKKQKVTQLQFYLHETSKGNNSTAFPIVQPKISFTSPTVFGQLNMIDDLLKVGPEPNSEIVGRAQGLTGFASLEEVSLIMAINFVFTNGKYNGSSLSVHGRNQPLDNYREMNIVGGSGVFRLAKGIVITQTIEDNATSGQLIAQYNVVVIHY